MYSASRSTEQKNKIEETLLENINYWKEAHKEIHEILQEFKGIMLLTHNSMEFADIIDFLNKVRPGTLLNILYISLLRSYDYMTVVLLRKKLENKRIFFIDCVSGYAFPSEQEIDDCIYHEPPHTLKEMKELIAFGVKKANPEIIVIDPLSQFINFSQPTESEIKDFYNFLQSLKEDTLGIMQNTIILLYDRKMGTMQHLPKISTDLILKIEVIREEARWKD
jgi:hypothetical protein